MSTALIEAAKRLRDRIDDHPLEDWGPQAIAVANAVRNLESPPTGSLEAKVRELCDYIEYTNGKSSHEVSLASSVRFHLDSLTHGNAVDVGEVQECINNLRKPAGEREMVSLADIADLIARMQVQYERLLDRS